MRATEWLCGKVFADSMNGVLLSGLFRQRVLGNYELMAGISQRGAAHIGRPLNQAPCVHTNRLSLFKVLRYEASSVEY
mgnify:CR=1 FL=1